MNQTFSLEELEKNSLTPNEYVYLYYLTKEQTVTFPIDLEKLEELKFVKIIGNAVIPRLKAHELFNNEDKIPQKKAQKEKETESIADQWQKLLDAYPKKEGNRRLHDKSVAKPKFERALKEGHSLDEMLLGLKNELKAREKASMTGGFFPAQKGLSTWINQRHWQIYLEDDQDDRPVSNIKIL